MTSTNKKIKFTQERRHRMICEAIYYISLERTYLTVNPTQDWIQAEAAIDKVCVIHNDKDDVQEYRCRACMLPARMQKGRAAQCAYMDARGRTTQEDKVEQLLRHKRVAGYLQIEPLFFNIPYLKIWDMPIGHQKPC